MTGKKKKGSLSLVLNTSIFGYIYLVGYVLVLEDRLQQQRTTILLLSVYMLLAAAAGLKLKTIIIRWS
jgi:hypothetical protein